MARGVLLPSIQGGLQLRATAKILREQGRKLQAEAGKAIKAEGNPTLDSLRESARTVKVVGVETKSLHKFTHKTKAKRLRERMANATVIEVRASEKETRVSFHVNSARMGDAKQIPRYIDLGARSGRAGWRHPIMGDREYWATSIGEPWFFPPIKEHLPKFRQRISAVLDEVVTKVEGS